MWLWLGGGWRGHVIRAPKGTPHAGLKKSILEEGFRNEMDMDLLSGFLQDSLSFLKESSGLLKTPWDLLSIPAYNKKSLPF